MGSQLGQIKVPANESVANVGAVFEKWPLKNCMEKLDSSQYLNGSQLGVSYG